jgi:hypothetical protein
MSINGAEWTPGVVCVFDGLQSVLERVAQCYEQRVDSKKAGEALRGQNHSNPRSFEDYEAGASVSAPVTLPVTLPEGVRLVEAEPILDRKSAFVGRACKISDPAQVITLYPLVHVFMIEGTAWQVPLVLAFLMHDRRVAKAAHPAINAWRCQVGNVLYQGRHLPLVFPALI